MEHVDLVIIRTLSSTSSSLSNTPRVYNRSSDCVVAGNPRLVGGPYGSVFSPMFPCATIKAYMQRVIVPIIPTYLFFFPFHFLSVILTTHAEPRYFTSFFPSPRPFSRNGSYNKWPSKIKKKNDKQTKSSGLDKRFRNHCKRKEERKIEEAEKKKETIAYANQVATE